MLPWPRLMVFAGSRAIVGVLAERGVAALVGLLAAMSPGDSGADWVWAHKRTGH